MLVIFDLHDLPPRPHATHLHTSVNCDAKTGLTSAGPILTLTPGSSTASWPKAAPKRVTCPTSSPAPTAHLHASTIANGFSIGNGKRSIFDKDDVVIVLDARDDNYCTQPLDNAGDRIACGVVFRTRGPAK
ncbi:MAG: superoxide dismutase family protein [Alphaproteobacteria bacterium]|nr:superoxide dismutase family protein [Alphaproteobacteria bacterium]